MSFSSDVKEELAGISSQARHCRIALLAALFHQCPYLEKNRAGIRTESQAAAAAFEHALCRVINGPVERDERGREIYIRIRREAAGELLEMLKLEHAAGNPEGWDEDAVSRIRSTRISRNLLQKTCCRKAFLRGMFLAAGSISDPAKSYHLEIAPLTAEDTDDLLELLSSIGFTARSTSRKSRKVVYLKDGEQISDFLGAIGATRSLMNLENARILRNIAGNINRQVNFEAANLKKTGIASGRQLEDIALIERTVGISSLPETLQQAALLRVENPDKSLNELARLCVPPVGRSGINHRLQRISQTADRIRESGSQ